MPKFWSFISDSNHEIGCTGQTVYIYRKNISNPVAVFKDLRYAYTSAISPDGTCVVVKSTEGRLAVYSLEDYTLIKKFRFSKINASQDDNFCFSPDGKEFYNIERHGESYHTVLSIYSTSDWSLKARFFEHSDTEISLIEYDKNERSYFLIGFFRNKDSNPYFVSEFENGELADIHIITEAEYDFYIEYKRIELTGFTDKSMEWLCHDPDGFDPTAFKKRNHTLAKLWRFHS